jgi:hypothetical protein
MHKNFNYILGIHTLTLLLTSCKDDVSAAKPPSHYD